MSLTPGTVQQNDGSPEAREQAYAEAVDHLVSLKGKGVATLVGAVVVDDEVHVVGVGNPVYEMPPLIMHLVKGLKAAFTAELEARSPGCTAGLDDDDDEAVNPFGRPDAFTPYSGTKH